MADKSGSGAWSNDWDALNKQFWNAWQETARQASQGGGKMPWHEGLEMWSRLFSTKAEGQGEVVDRMLASARQFFSMAQAAAQGATGQAGAAGAMPGMGANPFAAFANMPGGDAAKAWSEAWQSAAGGMSAFNNPMLEAMRSIAGEGAMGWEQLAAQTHQMAGPLKQEINALLTLPTFGYTREHQERFQKLVTAGNGYQEWLQRYNALMLKASQKAFEKMESKLGERSEPGREITSFRGLYDLWIDAAEEGYAEVALSQDFRHVYGQLVNAQMRVRKLVNEEVERNTQSVGMPTRTEVNTAHARIAEMRRRIARLEQALGLDAETASTAEAANEADEVGEVEADEAPVRTPRPRAAANRASRPAATRSDFTAQLHAQRAGGKRGKTGKTGKSGKGGK